MGLILGLVNENEIGCFDLSLCMVIVGASGKVPNIWMCVRVVLPRGSQIQVFMLLKRKNPECVFLGVW